MEKPKIIIEISGGVLQSVHSNYDDVDVEVYDYADEDTIEPDKEDLTCVY